MDAQLALRAKAVNLNAGPSPLPVASLLTAASSLLSYPPTPGLGIAEISHRSSAFQKVVDGANADLRKLLAIPDNYKVLWMQGGGLTQFSATVLNLESWYRIKNKLAKDAVVEGEYVVTGSWSKKALEEGQRMGVKAKVILDGKKAGGGKFRAVPQAEAWDLSSHDQADKGPKPAFVYYCDNETVDGVEFPATAEHGGQPFPFDKIDKDVPVVCDMSSNFLSRPVDVSKYGIIYAGAQKNLGPSGVSVVIVREDLIVDPDHALEFGGARVPAMLAYKNLADSDSMYNTPPTFAIYLCSLVLTSLLASPPYPLATPTSPALSPLAELADHKSSLVYSLVASPAEANEDSFYLGTADEASRSRMNVTFRIKGGEAVEKAFVKTAAEKGFVGVAGHRSVGGIRTSIYNAVTLDQVKALVAFMKEFEAANAKA
ncbi:phosphoserine aminotransferase [Meredithblackwellia eburnea MCA 4105]